MIFVVTFIAPPTRRPRAPLRTPSPPPCSPENFDDDSFFQTQSQSRFSSSTSRNWGSGRRRRARPCWMGSRRFVHEPRPQALRVRRIGRLGHYRPQLGDEGEESIETEEGKGSYHPEEEDGRPRLRALRVVRWALFLLSGWGLEQFWSDFRGV